ncbi:MAG TPA: long-chain fatty acid--CoA ligase [Pyrinomonadaceae bacterium]|nr:long-chain fatty acid--CoA ligase [Pyrinomonadaceae bacterium]
MAKAAAKKTDSTTSRETSSVPGLILGAVTRHNKNDALNYRSEGKWYNIPATEFVHRVENAALGLASLGVRPGDRIVLLSENRPEWSVADLAILSLGAINVPIYTTQALDQVDFILSDSGAKAIFISNRRLYKQMQSVLAKHRLDRLIFFEEDVAEDVEKGIALSQLEQSGKELAQQRPGAFDAHLQAVRPDDLATIIYTSGTTGEPKGVMLTHNNFISNVMSIGKGLPIGPTDVALSVLPLSHIFERDGFYVFLYCGVSVHYSPSFDQVGENLREVAPTVMTAVPRLFEKVYHRIIKKGMSEKGFKKSVFMRSLQVGQQYGERKDKRKWISPQLGIKQKLASKLVFSKWREGVGGRLRYFVSGGAPLSPALSYSYLAAGIPILQGYGATETCIVSANRPDNNHVGSVGIPFEGIDIKIAEDGEILVRGPNVMRGYYGQPEATAAVLKDGWFYTGDVGYLAKDGQLFITDRKKDLFKLSNGKYVAPQLIESLLKQSEFVSQVVVVGAGRKQPVALIVPDWESLRAALAEAGEDDAPKDRVELSQYPPAVKIVQRDIANLTAQLVDYERIRRIALLPHEFTIDGGELTPTLKVKRKVVDERYGDLIEDLYK